MEHKWKKDWKNGTEQSVNYKKTSKGIVCMQCKSSQEKKERQKTIFEGIISGFQINKSKNPTDPRNSMNLSEKNIKKTKPNDIEIKLPKANAKRKF